MTRQEYDILREHGERLITLETGMGDIRERLAALPGIIAEDVGDKVAAAVRACRAEGETNRQRLDELWEARQQGKGVRSFWSTLGKVLAALCALAGLVTAMLAILPH